ncbi:FAS1 domain superfamily [Sesbania bispinosa]|nr:FAS1 domain superfamily [Sesbania bispinosa]
MNNINSQLITAKSGGLTILAPDDAAFSQLKAGNPVQTVAGKDPTRLPLNVNALGNSVNISTGVVNASIVGVVYSDNKLAIYRLDKVLLPLDFFVTKAPALAPTLAKAPKAAKENAAADDDQEETNQEHNKSGAESLSSIHGTMLMSLGIALVAVAMIWT